MKKVTFSGWAAWVFVGFWFVLGMLLGTTVFGDKPVQYVEWWYVQGADGTPCEVCEYCYQLFNE